MGLRKKMKNLIEDAEYSRLPQPTLTSSAICTGIVTAIATVGFGLLTYGIYHNKISRTKDATTYSKMDNPFLGQTRVTVYDNGDYGVHTSGLLKNAIGRYGDDKQKVRDLIIAKLGHARANTYKRSSASPEEKKMFAAADKRYRKELARFQSLIDQHKQKKLVELLKRHNTKTSFDEVTTYTKVNPDLESYTELCRYGNSSVVRLVRKKMTGPLVYNYLDNKPDNNIEERKVDSMEIMTPHGVISYDRETVTDPYIKRQFLLADTELNQQMKRFKHLYAEK